MRKIYNPHTKSVATIFGEPGQGVGYEIKAGETAEFLPEFYPVADHFLTMFEFLEEKKVEGEKPVEGSFTCSKCGRGLKNKAGKITHEKHCKEEKSTPVVGKPLEKRKKTRSEMEDEGFVDMPAISTGVEKTEVIGNRNQKIVYDRDGVGWYGPGVENDTVPRNIRKPGSF